MANFLSFLAPFLASRLAHLRSAVQVVSILPCVRARLLFWLASYTMHACMLHKTHTHTHTHTRTRRSICAGLLSACVANSLNGSHMALDVFLSVTVNIVCCLGSERHAHVRERTDVTGLTGKTPNTDVRQVASVFPVVVIVFVFVVVCVCVCARVCVCPRPTHDTRIFWG